MPKHRDDALDQIGRLPRARRGRRVLRLMCEPLEERTMLDGTPAVPPPAIVVGRTLSSYAVGAIQNNQATITYTVYNGQADPETGVRLSTTLAPGVTLASASAPPDRNGQDLAWSLGTVPGFGRINVTLNVTLASPTPLQLDAGPRVSATLNGGPVSDAAPAATLRAGSVDAPLLGPTPDANSADPYVQEVAARLDYDPQRIFDYLNTAIGYESYSGSLRGARGTIWAAAGNSLDEASLGVALFRASGIPARYAHGSLPDPVARQLILTMFPEPLRVVGCLDDGTPLSGTANDPQLLAEARDHYWVQVDLGTGFQDADPSGLPGAAIGAAPATASDTFAEVPDDLRHKVQVTLKAETYSQIAAAFGLGGGLGTRTVLDVPFNTVDLVGRPLSLGHFVSADGIGSPVFSSTTITYSPYLRVNEAGGDPAADVLYRGTDYQEVRTNFPLGSQLLTGLFLDVTVLSPAVNGVRAQETVEKVLFDRIGFAARQSGSSSSVSVGADPAPAVTDLDITTLVISPAPEPDSVLASRQAQLAPLANDLSDRLPPAGSGDPSGADGASPGTQSSLKAVVARTTSLMGAALFSGTERVTSQVLAPALLARVYSDSPFIAAASSTLVVDQSGSAGELRFGFDVLRDKPRSYGSPIQAALAEPTVRFERGVMLSSFEEQILRDMAAGAGTVTSSYGTFLAAVQSGARLVTVDASSVGQVSALGLSDEAKARITRAVLAGQTVIVPDAPVQAGGRSTVAWLELDTATGNSIYVSEDGNHAGTFIQSIVARFALLAGVPLLGRFAASLGGRLLAQHAITIARISLGAGTWFGLRLREYAAVIAAEIQQMFRDPKFTQDVLKAFNDAIDAKLKVDPPVGNLLYSPAPSPQFAGLAPTGTSTVAADIINDPAFSVEVGGAQVPTVFRVGIKNSGPATQVFTLTPKDVPAGFRAMTSVTRVTIPAGQTAEVGICLTPAGGVPPAGTQLTFGVEVTSTTDPTLTAVANETFTVPAIDGVTISSDSPAGVSTTPGVGVTATLTLTNVGNMPETIGLAATGPGGLTIGGLAPLTLQPGQSTTQVITLTPAASTPLGTTLPATITATFGPSGSPRTQAVTLGVRVVAPGVAPLAAAADAAAEVDNAGLAGRLADLADALTRLFQNPADAVAKGQATANLDSLITQTTNDPFLASFTAGLAAARGAIAAASSAADVQAALTALGNAVGPLATAIADEAAHGFTLGLEPARIVVQPNVPAVFSIDLKNLGSRVTTYDLSVSGLPAGVNASFSRTTITLNPGQEVRAGSGAPTLTLTETGSSLVAGRFTVTVTAEGAAEIADTVEGALTLRSTFLQVASVSTAPPFVAPGANGPGAVVQVSARVQSALNQPQSGTISYVVLDQAGNTVFTSAAVPLVLDPTSALVTVDLGPLDTTGLPQGLYTLVATIADASGQPIAGTAGRGSFVVGLPVTADVATTPAVVPTGTDTVTTTVHVHGTVALPSPLSILGQVNTGDNELSTVLYGNNLAYVVGLNGVSIVDVADPTNPQLLKTFAQTEIIQGGYNIAQVVGTHLIVATTVTLNASGFNFIVYDLADPLNPTLVSNTPINQRFLGDMYVLGDIALVTIGEIDFFGGGSIFAQLGNTVALDISDLAHPTVAGVLFGSGNPEINHPEGGAVILNSQVAYVVSSTSTGGDTQHGIGRLRRLDISNPAQPTLAGTLDIPGTVTLTNIALQGNRALVAGSTGGLLNPFGSLDKLKNTGNLTLTVLDVSDPNDPRILGNTLVTEVTFPTSSVPTRGDLRDLGNGLFALSAVESGGKPALLLIDASDPGNIVVSALNPPTNVNGLTVSGHTLYAGTPAGLSIYDIGQLVSQPVTVSVRVPKDSADVSLVPGSFDKPPTQIVAGAGFDTYVWNRSLAFGNTDLSFSWKTTLRNLAAGDARDVTLGTAVASQSQGTPVALDLPGTRVTAASIIAITPPAQAAPPGGTATYVVRLTNPLAVPVTYNVSLPALGVAVSRLEKTSVTIGANSSTDILLTVAPDPRTAAGAYPFTVTATDAANTGVTGSAQATLDVAGAPIPRADTVAHGVVATLTPARATAGQGTEARYVVRVTNTGSEEDSFFLSIAGLPQGITAAFADNVLDIPPGAGNFRDVALVLTSSTGTPAGSYPFTVTADDGGTSSSTAAGTLDVVAAGVGVSLTPSSGAPGSGFQATVTNTGTVADTFDLALAGPAALVSSLGSAQVTLAPGASMTVPIATGAAGFALPGPLGLTVVAASHTDPAVKDGDSASLTIAPSRGVSAEFTPASRTLAAPGAATFQLTVRNTGNTEDSYEAVIVGVQGPVTARLMGLDGLPTQVIPLFGLPALGTGAIELRADLLSALQQGLITVMVRSTTDGSVAASATASVSAAATTVAATTTVLTVSPPGPVTAGQSVTLTATVRSATGGSTPTGTVTFLEGSRVLGTARLDAGGHATLALPTGQTAALAARAVTLGVGTHRITAVYHGDATHAGSRSAAVSVVVRAVTVRDVDGPRVTSLLRYGYHAQPTVLVLQFNRALDPATAQDVRNYTLVNLGGPGRGGAVVGRPVRVLRAVYDPARHAVSLYPAGRLDVHNTYRLTAHGAKAGGITDAAGRRLDGRGNGKPGSNFVGLITRRSLAGPVSASGAILNSQSVPRNVPALSAAAIDLLAASGKLTAGPSAPSPLHDAGSGGTQTPRLSGRRFRP